MNLSHVSTLLVESVCNRRTVLLIIPSLFVTASIMAVVGFIVFAYNTVIGCDPLANHEIATGNEVPTLYFRLQLKIIMSRCADCYAIVAVKCV